jgi:hypothetical protein
MSKKCSRQRLWLLALYAGGVVVATLQRGVWSREHTTFSIFRQSFTHLARHQNLYAAYPAEQGAAAVDLFKYSPSAAVLFAPLTLMPYPVALLFWNLLNAGLLVYALTRLLPAAKANLALVLLAPEVFVAIQSSSSNALVTALILLAAAAYESGRLLHGGYALVVGAAMKIFPLAGLILAALHARRGRAAIAAGIAFAAMLALPLLVVSPRELLQQYQWWAGVETSDARDMIFGMSLMRQLREWWHIGWPNWTIQAAGTALFLLPIAVRRDRWSCPSFRIEYLCSLLIYVVLFNHQAERQSFVIAATGSVIWFVTSPRTMERGVLLALALIGVPTVPYVVLWLVIQTELMRPAPAVVGTPRLVGADEELRYFLRRWSGSFRAAS